MKRILKWIGIVLGVLVGLIVLAAIFVYLSSQAQLNKVYTAPEVNVIASTDPAVIERGRHLATAVSVCVDCHNADLGGKVLLDDPALGRISALNLTKGKNGKGNELSDADFGRVLRYGVLPNGLSVKVMPAEDYTHFSDEDLTAVISYVRSLPPVDSDLPPTEIRMMGRILMVMGQLPILIADRIDQALPHVASIEPGVSLEYGQYLANVAGCTGCHGPGLSGGPIPGAPPDFPPAANLTPSGELVGWSEADFLTLIRTGEKPSGTMLNETMPYKYYANMTDDELKAIWMFVKSVPAREAGTR
jgi:mono/diheme cytochrome c family protein